MQDLFGALTVDELLTPGAVFSRRSEISFTKHTHQGQLKHTHSLTHTCFPLLAISGHGAHITQWVSLFYSEWLSLSPSPLILLFTRSHCLLSSFSRRGGGCRDSAGWWWHGTGGGSLVTRSPGESSHPGADQPARLSCSASLSVSQIQPWAKEQVTYPGTVLPPESPAAQRGKQPSRPVSEFVCAFSRGLNESTGPLL